MNKTKLIRDFAKIILLVFIILLFDMHTVQTEAAVKDLKLNKTSAMLKVGETLQLKVSNAGTKVIWSTDNVKIATVTNGSPLSLIRLQCSSNSELLWLTDYKSGKGVSADNLRMVKINDDKFALIYQIVKKNEDSRTYGTGIIIIDSNGTVQQQKEYDTYFSTFTQPIYYDNSIVWIDSKLTTEDIYTEKTEESKEKCQFTRIYLD